MNNFDVFEQMQNTSSMYLASNKELQCNANYGVDIRDIRLFEVTNQTYDTISKNLYAIENVLDAMQSQTVTCVYLIQGTSEGIHYYYGVAPLYNTDKQKRDISCEIQQGEDVFLANFEVNYPGSNIVELNKEEKQTLHQELMREQSCAVLEGVPGVISSSTTTLGMDRFVNVMEQESFLVMVLAQPLPDNKVKDIVCEQQAVLDFLVPFLEFSKINQQSNINEVASFVDRSRTNTRSQTNTASEQLQFQMFTASGSIPLKIGKGSLQQIEDLFFVNGVANNDLIDLMNTLFLQQEENKKTSRDTSRLGVRGIAKESLKDTTVTSAEVNKHTVTTKEIGNKKIQDKEIQDREIPNNMRPSKRRNPFGISLMNRNNQNMKRSYMRPDKAILCPESEYKITEENVTDVGDKIMRYLDNTDSLRGAMKENRENRKNRENRDMVRIQELKEDQEEDILDFEDVEELVTNLFEGQNEFTLASINRQDSRAKARIKSCSSNSKLAANSREACTNICSVTERYTNQAVSSWNRYLMDIVNSRLVYGENRGIYVCSTIIFAGKETNLNKVVAAWRGMNEYDTISKVPITDSLIYKNTNQYNNIVNFQIPRYCYLENNKTHSLAYQEVLARCAYSQFIEGDYVYGGNWISSKELRHMVALPSKSSCIPLIRRGKKERNLELSITSVRQSSFPDLDRKKMRHGFMIIGERHSGKEETLKNLLLKIARPFTLLEFDSGRYSTMFKGSQRIERYPILMSAGKILKLNPFELFPDELIDNHIELLLAILIHCYRFDQVLIDMIKSAIYDSYAAFGWNLHTNSNDKFGKSAYTKEVKAFPTFLDVLIKTEEIIKKKVNERELQLKCISRVREALNGWTIGKKGTLLGAEHNMNLTALMEQNISIELEELANEADRKFFILLYMWRCMAMRKSQGRTDYISSHVIVCEDIRRILSKGCDVSTPWEENAVETITEYLVTTMKYGESIVLIEEGVGSLPSNIKSELYAVFMHQISSLKERCDLEQWLNLGKEHLELIAELGTNESLCITRDNQEIYECKL